MDRLPTLTTSRLRLRQLEFDDLEGLARAANNPKIAAEILNLPHPFGEPEAVFRLSRVVQGFKKKARFAFAIFWRQTGELVGEISLNLMDEKSRAELGYWVAEPFWQRGIATEAARAVVDFGFEKLGLTVILATSNAENTASHRILEKNGFEKKGAAGRVWQFVLEKKI